MRESILPVPGLCDALRSHVQPLHHAAEGSGIVQAMIQGRASRFGYALLLRNLLPAYRNIECRLESLREHPALREVADRPVYRSGAIESDLETVQGPGWEADLPLLREATEYADRVSSACPVRIIAHAYVRYLGDLSGGRMLGRLVGKAYGLDAQGLSFYAYPGVGDLDQYRAWYRSAIDRAPVAPAEIGPVLEEAAQAFRHNIAVSEAVLAAAPAVDRAH